MELLKHVLKSDGFTADRVATLRTLFYEAATIKLDHKKPAIKKPKLTDAVLKAPRKRHTTTKTTSKADTDQPLPIEALKILLTVLPEGHHDRVKIESLLKLHGEL